MGEDQCECDPSVLLLLLQFQVSGPQGWFSLEESTRADSLQKVWRARGEILCSGVLYLSYVHIHINQLGDASLRSSVGSGSFELLSSLHGDEQTSVPT